MYYQTQLRTKIVFDLFTRSRLWRSFLVAALGSHGWRFLSPRKHCSGPITGWRLSRQQYRRGD